MATLGLDTSAYEQGVSNVQKDTKRTVAQLSTEYSKAAKSVSELTRKYNESAEKTGKNSKETKELKSQLSAAEAQLKTTSNALKAANNGMDTFGQKTAETSSKQKNLTESLAGSIAKAQALTNAVTSLGSKLKGYAEKAISLGVEYNSQIETYRTGLTNMLGDAEAANQALENMKQDAARTPFDTASIVQANQYLIGAGENAAYARKTILALGDAVSATGGGSDELNRMAQNLQQIANVGKASSVDIKQFAFAGINIYQVLADYTGKSVKDVQSMTITYDTLTKALQAAAEEGGRYYNSMETQSQTLAGRLSTLKDNASQLAGSLTEKLTAAFGNAVTKANELMIAMKDGWETDGFEGMMDAAAETIPQLEGVTDAVIWLKENGSKLFPILTTLAGSFVAMKVAAGAAGALGAITSLFNPLGMLAGLLITAYTQNEDFRTIVNDSFGKVWSFCAPIFSKLLNGLEGVRKAFKNAASAARDFWNAQKNGGSSTDSDGFGGSDGGDVNLPQYINTTTDAERERRKTLHDTRVQKSQLENIYSSLTGGDDEDDTSSSSSGSSTKKTPTETVLSTVTDSATDYTKRNDLGRLTIATTEKTEDILNSEGERYKKFTRTITESGKEMVNGVAKNYKLVTTETKKLDETGKQVGETVTQTQKVYEDASQTLLGTVIRTAQQLVNGISTTVEKVTQTYADGSSQLVQTTTETGERLVNGALETYTKIKKIAEDGTETTSETSQAVVSEYDTLNSAYGAASKRVDELTALYNESVAATGEFSYQSKNLAGMLNEAETKLDSAKSALKEYEKTTNRTNVQTERLIDRIKKANSGFSDFGSSITALGEFFDSETIQNAGDFFTTITDGVDKVINLAASTKALVTTLQELQTALQAINTTGGVSGMVSGIGKLLGIGAGTAATGTTVAAGAATTEAAAAGAAGAAATTSTAAAGTAGVAALGLSIPQIGLIVAGVLGVAAVGYGIYKWATKDKDKTKKDDKLSYKNLQDAYWYGNERAFAGYDYRTDPYTFRSDNAQAPLRDYQNKVQEQLGQLFEVVQKYLPQAGNGVLAVDGEELGRIVTPSVNANLGQLTVLSGRGN